LNEASIAFIPGSDAGVDRYWLQGVGLWGNPGDFVLGINGPRMVITPDGNVGIGTANPLPLGGTGNFLSVDGNIVVDFGGTGDGATKRLEFGSSPDHNTGEWISSKRTAGENQYGLDFYTNFSPWLSITNGGNVGIGTTDPEGTLHVDGGKAPVDTDGKSILLKAQDGGDEVTRLRPKGGHILLFPGQSPFGGGIIDNGHVGIGTMDPLGTLTINDNILNKDPTVPCIMIGNRGNCSIFMGNDYTKYGEIAWLDPDYLRILSTKSIHFQVSGHSDDADIVFNANGNVGIGTKDPGAPLHLNSPVTGFGMLRLQNSNPGLNEASMAFIPGSDAGVDRYWLQGVGLWGNSGDFVLGINGPRMVMTPEGKVGIGTTSPSHMLHVNNGDIGVEHGSVYANGFAAFDNPHYFIAPTYATSIRVLGDIITEGGGSAAIGATSPGQYRLFVNGAAAKTDGKSTWDVFSDVRLKDIQGTYDKGLKEIQALTPIVYSYKKDNTLGLPSDKQAVGFSAQEVQKVIPEAVREDSSGYLTVSNDPIILAMFNAIKELKAENDQLRSQLQEENQSLKTKLERLEQTVTQLTQPQSHSQKL
jgi:hypothetical protein